MEFVRKKSYKNQTPDVRFWKKTDKNGPIHPVLRTRCWMWTGGCDSDGYGEIHVTPRTWRTHQFSWMLHFGEIPNGLSILHHCDIPRCVNPEHLFLGTNRENIADRNRKGRESRGEDHYCHKLTERDVRVIRKLYQFGKRGHGAKAIAAKFGVAKPAIVRIINGTGWKHVK